MNVVARKTLEAFWTKHPSARGPLLTWFTAAKRATWRGPADIKAVDAAASFLANDRVVFNLGGNHFRLIMKVVYRSKTVFVRFVGTHAEYDRVDATKV